MNLPTDIINFFKWWFIDGPKKLIIIWGRILALVNNEASFILNLKMLFVPLFGDYTIIGRLMGLVYRTIKIIIGTIVIIALIVFGTVLVISWYFLPFFAFHYIDYLTFACILMLFLVWRIAVRNRPAKKISETPDTEVLLSYRPATKHILRQIERDEELGLGNFFNNPGIKILLKRLELGDDFVNSLPQVLVFNFDNVAKISFDTAKKQNTRYVELEHLFMGLLVSIENVERLLSKFDTTLETCEKAVYWIVEAREEKSRRYFWQDNYKVPVIGGINKAMTGRVTPALDEVSQDLTLMAQFKRFGKITAHKKKRSEIIRLLSSGGSNVLIIGPPGSGKTSIVRGIAQEIVKGTKEFGLKFKRIVSIDTGTLISGTSNAGEISKKVERAMKDAEGSANIILFFDEIHNLVVADAAGGSTIFSILEPYLASRKFQIIGATNIENYRKYIEPNGSFARLFTVVEISETDEHETIEVMENIAHKLEKEYNTIISFPAIENTYDLSRKLIHNRVFPDKGIDVLARAAIEQSRTDRYVTKNDVAEVVAGMTHIPTATVTEKESEKLLRIEDELKKRVIGQDHALKQIGNAMKRARAGVRNEDKPIAVFMFVGTTGVGKTETAKALAETYFGDRKAMIRLDMSEYQQQDSMSRLIGAPDGSTKGVLTEAVRERPFSIVLLDEIEKANPQVILTFLQVFDDGRLTDSSGTTIDFTNTIIISTSNVGTRAIQEISQREGSYGEMNEAVMRKVRDHFAPEFLNRFSGVIVYNPLDEESLREITRLMLVRVQKNMDEKNITVRFKPELIEELMRRGYNEEWGARPMARVLEDSVETKLAEKMLAKQLQHGDEIELGVEVFDR